MTLSQAEMEARYDATRLSPVAPEALSAQEEVILKMLIEISPPDPEEGYAASFKRGFADGMAIVKALQAEEQLDQIDVTRHTHHSDGSPAREPWTTYTFGEASIDIQDSGVGSVVVGRDMLCFTDAAQLLDLALLLADERVLEALDPSTPE